MISPESYEPSKEVKDLVARSRILFIVGPSGTGKNTVISKLIESQDFHEIITATTRPPRFNHGIKEKDGEVYHFVSKEQFEEMVRKRELVEFALVHNQHYYGTPVSEFFKTEEENKIALADIEVKGVSSFLKLNPDIKIIFLLPPDLETLINRITKRDNHELNRDDLRERLNTSLEEYSYASDNPKYYFVINDNLDGAVREIEDYIDGKIKNQDHLKEHIENLKQQIRNYLTNL